MPALKHVHSYTQYKRRKGFYRCLHPQCTHFADRENVLGKTNLCPICKTVEFVLTRDDLRRVTPRCKECSNTESAKLYKTAKSVLDDLLKEGES